MIPIVQVRKLGLRDVKALSHGRRASEWSRVTPALTSEPKPLDLLPS